MKFGLVKAAMEMGSLSHWERVGVRGYGVLSSEAAPPHPDPPGAIRPLPARGER